MARAQAQRRRNAPSRARRSASSAEDLMFFPKLRRRAKWVFLFLAIAFALGFVAFGVGTGVGGTSIGDVLRDIFTSNGNPGDLDSAKKDAAAKPDDANAQIAYANALQAAGQSMNAADVLQRYTTSHPKNVEALRQLAGIWGSIAQNAQNEARAAQAAAAEATAGQAPAPADSPFLQHLQGNKINEVITGEANAKVSAASARAQNAFRQAAQSYEQLTLLTPNDPNSFLQLGFVSQSAADYPSAIAAYQRFLELAPNDPNAPLIKQQLKILQAQQKASSSLPSSG